MRTWMLVHRCVPLKLTLYDTSVYWVCCCVDAPLVSSCLPARVDSAGKPACEDCGRRLSTCKGKLHKKEPGHICHRCYTKGSRPPSAALSIVAPTATLKRSHKRRADSDPGTQPADTNLPAQLESPSLPCVPPQEQHCSTAASLSALPLLLQPNWLSHQWRLRPSCRRTRATAAAWMAVINSGKLKRWQEKRGGHIQHDTHISLACAAEDGVRVRLVSGSEQLGRDMLAELGEDSSRLKLAGIKLLSMQSGEGQQDVHYDIHEYSLAKRCFTLLIYLTPTLSTAVSPLPLSDLRHTFTAGQQKPPLSFLCKITKDKLYTTRVEAGDAMVFRCDVPHCALANPDAHTRYVCFMLFSPKGEATPDTEDQRYPHEVEN